MPFSGFGPQAIPFFKALAFHQTKDWFDANRAIYDDAKARWRIAYAARKTLVDKGVTKAKWSAPGTLSESQCP